MFGVIKAAMGSRQFLLGGMRKVRGERALMRLARNLKRMRTLRHAVVGLWKRPGGLVGSVRARYSPSLKRGAAPIMDRAAPVPPSPPVRESSPHPEPTPRPPA